MYHSKGENKWQDSLRAYCIIAIVQKSATNILRKKE